MITLENYVLEQEINDATFIDAYAEQAIAEMNVMCALLDSYVKEETILEYCESAGVDADVILEHDDPNKPSFYEDPKNGVRAESRREKWQSKWEKFTNFLKKAADAFVITLQTIYSKLTRVPVKTIKKNIEKVKNLDESRPYFEITLNPYFIEIIEGLLDSADNIKDAIASEDLKSITDALGKYERDDKAMRDRIKYGREKNSEDNDYSAEGHYDIDEFVEKVLDPLEKRRVDTKISTLIKDYKKLVKTKLNAIDTKESRKSAREEEGGIYNPKTVKKVVTAMRDISKELTIMFSEYTKAVNKAIGDRYKIDKEFAKNTEMRSNTNSDPVIKDNNETYERNPQATWFQKGENDEA